jgi:hypothetical protein
MNLYTSSTVAPRVSAGLAGLRVRACFFLTREALPVGRNSLPAPVPAGTGSRLYLRPPGRVPAGTRVFLPVAIFTTDPIDAVTRPVGR